MATYATEAQLTTYCTERNIAVPTELSSILIKASDFISATFYDSLIGSPVDENQELLFPRVDDYGNAINEANVIKACCSLALRAVNGELFEDNTKRVIKEKLDVLETTYDTSSSPQTFYSDVYAYMRPYLKNGLNNRRLERV